MGKPWISGSLLAEPSGELNIQTDKGVQSYFRAPHCPSRWFWARWLQRRGQGGGSQVFIVAAEMWKEEFTCPPPCSPSDFYSRGATAQPWQMCSLGRFPGAVLGKWAINPMPGPVLARCKVGECVFVFFGFPCSCSLTFNQKPSAR